MSLILKQESSANVPTPPAGKGTLYLNTSDQVVVKDSAGNTSTFPTVSATGNTQVFYNDAGSLTGDASFTFDKTNDTVTISNLTVTGTLSAGDISVSSIANGTSNVDINGVSGNVTTSVAGVANVLVVTSTGANITGTANISGNANVGNIGATGAVFTTIAGSLTTASQPNVTALGTLTGLLVGATASNVDFPNAKSISSQDNSGVTADDNIGILAEAVANSANTAITGIGVLGVGRVVAATKATGVQGEGHVTSTGDTGAAVGVRGYATDTHSAGYNIGVLGNAMGSGTGNYAFYVQNGGIASIENDTFWDLSDNSNVAITFNSTGKANIFRIDTTDSAEGIATSGYLTVAGNANITGNATVGGVKTDNYYYANGSPVDFQQAGGSNTQIQFNDNDQFGGSANFTFDKTTQALLLNGNATFQNANLGNLGTANYLAGTLTTASQPNITSVGTLGSLTVTNKVTAGQLQGDGGNISNIQGANVSGAVASATSATTAGTVTTAAQPNITSVGTLSSLAVTGNVTSGNVYANSGTIGASLLTGTLTTNAQPNVTSVGTLTSLAVTGNVTAGNIVAPVANGNSNLNIPATNGNVNISAAGNANVLVVTGTGVNVAGTLNATGIATVGGNLNVTGNAVITGNLTVDGNLVYVNVDTLAVEDPIINLQTGPNGAAPIANSGKDVGTALNYYDTQARVAFMGWDVSNTEFGMADQASIVNEVVTFTSYGNLRVGNIIGNGQALSGITGANVTGQVANALVAGTVYTASQPNITSVGTLTSLAVTGNITSGNIDGGNLVKGNYVQGTLTTNAQPNITSVGTLTSLDVTGNITSGNANLGNLATANYVQGTLTTAAQPNITSVGTLTSLNVTGNTDANNFNATTNVIAGNVYANSGTIGANLLTGTLTTAAQPNITSVGTLTSLSVTGNITSGNIDGGNLVKGNYVQGTLTTAAQPNVTSVGTLTSLDVTGNTLSGNVYANSGTIGASLLTGTLTTNAQPNITSVGTLSSLTVTGNVGAGNVNGGNLVTANYVAGTLTTAAQPNITSVGTLSSLVVSGNSQANGNVITDNILGRTGAVTVTAAGTDTNINLVPNGTGTVDVASKRITSLAAPTQSTDAATKDYVDQIAQGLHVHAPSLAATPDTLANISGGTITYNNGSSGVGANLVTTGSYTTIDGVNIATVGTRILVKNESNAAHNGIYTYTSSTVLTRATDFDSPTEMAGGDFTFVQQGTLYNDTGWVMTDPVTTVGTTAVTFVQFSGAGTYTAGTGLTLAGTQFSITNTTVTPASYGNGDRVASFTVNGQGQLTAASDVVITANAGNLTGTTLNSSIVTSSLTSVGTLGSLSVTGNTTSGNVYANSGTIGANLLTGTLTTAAQPNVTSVGTLTSLSVTGNITSGNANLGNLATANFVAGTLTTAAQPNITSVGTLSSLVVTGNTTSGNVYANSGTIGASLLTGTLTTAAQPNITSVGTLTSLSVSGNVSGANFIGNFANGNSDINIPAANGNINFDVAGNANVLVVTGTGVNVAGTLNATGNANVGNLGATGVVATTLGGSLTTASQPNITTVGTLSSLTVTNKVTAGQLQGDGGNISNIQGANVSGTVANATYATSAGTAGSATTAGTVTTASQPNITSVGTLSSLAVTGNITGGNLIGPYANGNSNVNIPAANGNVNISAVGNANVVVVTGTGVNIAGTLNATGIATVGGNLNVSGNAVISGNLTVDGNLTYVNVDTLAVEDPIINLQTGANGAAPTSNSGKDVGTALNYYDTQARIAFMGWDVSNVEFGLASQASITNEVVTFSTYGNLRVGNIIGNGQALTALAGANVTGQVANALVAGTVYTASQPNITSVGTLSSVAVSGNANVGNLNATTAVVASTLTSNVSTGTAPLTVTSTTRVANLNVNYANVADFVNVTAPGTGTGYIIFANATTGNVAEYTSSGISSNLANNSITATTFVGALSGAATTAGTVTTAAQPNITSVGTLTSLGSSGNITAPNFIANTGYFISSVNAAVSAAGTVQGNATALTTAINVVSTVASGAGVKLPTATAGMRVTIMNTSANALLVYPETNGIINSGAANAAFSLAAAGRLDFVSVSTTQWYTLGATYA